MHRSPISLDLKRIKTENSTGAIIQDLSYTYYSDGQLESQTNALAPPYAVSETTGLPLVHKEIFKLLLYFRESKTIF
jgi:hypothetical protein